MECSICQENYNQRDRKPYLINPCGHCFCSTCLNSFQNNLCPNRRGVIGGKIINRPLLDLLDENERKVITTAHLNDMVYIKILGEHLRLDKAHDNKLMLIDQMKEKIQRETEEKIDEFLRGARELISQIDRIDTFEEIEDTTSDQNSITPLPLSSQPPLIKAVVGKK
jgi:hypothetical protein